MARSRDQGLVLQLIFLVASKSFEGISLFMCTLSLAFFVKKKRGLRKQRWVIDLLSFSTNSAFNSQTTLDAAKNRLVPRARHTEVAQTRGS